MTELNRAIKIQTTINITFFTKDFHSLPCHVSIMYIIPLYNIIVTDKAIVKINNNLALLTIIDFLVLNVLLHTVLTLSPKSIVISLFLTSKNI